MNTSKFVNVSVILLTVITLTGCPCSGFKEIKTPEGKLAVPECCKIVEYSKTSVSVTGVKLSIPKVPVEIGGVTVEPRVITQACEIVQILDQHRMSTCQLLPSYATISRTKFVEALDAMQKSETIITQLALIVASKDGTAIQEFARVYCQQVHCEGSFSLTVKQFKPVESLKVFSLKELSHH